jgi:hypothetical protein
MKVWGVTVKVFVRVGVGVVVAVKLGVGTGVRVAVGFLSIHDMVLVSVTTPSFVGSITSIVWDEHPARIQSSII